MYEVLKILVWKGLYASCVAEDDALKDRVYELGLKVEMSANICGENISEILSTSEF